LANRLQADLFVSIHINAAPGPEAHGVETYVLASPTDPEAALLAERENREILALSEAGTPDPDTALLANLIVSGNDALSLRAAASLQQSSTAWQYLDWPEDTRDLGVKGALFTVLAASRRPAVLHEVGFLSNPQEERRLRTPYFQDQTAQAIARAILTSLGAP
jgi:N-acetylmuramoyl-L-alanine amidase